MPAEGGLRVPVGDARALAAALVALLGAPERRVAMGTANLGFIREHCDWERVIDDLEAVYAELLRRPSSG
jgi:glycosyltransferase involved in cell wall biosynthesis